MEFISKESIVEKFGTHLSEKYINYKQGFQDGIKAVLELPTEHSTSPTTRPLDIEELEEIYENNEGVIWVKLLDYNDLVFPAILDYTKGNLVAIWNATEKEGLLYASDYDDTWIAYENKPVG